MLNEDKIRLMTGIAMYEKKAEKDVFPVTRYFKSDYIGSHLIRSFITYTFTCLMFVAIWILYQIEDIFNMMDISILMASAKYIGILYLIGLVCYLLVTLVVYSKRYNLASKSLKVYQAKLRRLEKNYTTPSEQNGNEEERQS
ncbi:MAG: hypothetical protein IKU20_06035 [Lachnospiraceae bacterium]|nr:hypothetical protein [Lachnospiraceae bacterium]